MAASSFLPTDLGREDNVEVGHLRSGALQSLEGNKRTLIVFTKDLIINSRLFFLTLVPLQILLLAPGLFWKENVMLQVFCQEIPWLSLCDAGVEIWLATPPFEYLSH
ncbi:hypothetical protein TNCV_4730181 [Trichonephila clavipes]|nr:hypothetical protein TNCV_4730181 [Trichonephila clavipes]